MSRFVESPAFDGAENHWRPASREAVLSGKRQQQLTGGTLATPSSTPDSTADGVDWLRAWTTIQKHWRLSAAFAISVMITIVLVTVLTDPTYAPVARVEIDPPGDELFSMEDHGRIDAGADYLETQARNMQSDELLVSVIRQLQLDRVPAFTQRGFITRSIATVFRSMEKIPV